MVAVSSILLVEFETGPATLITVVLLVQTVHISITIIGSYQSTSVVAAAIFHGCGSFRVRRAAGITRTGARSPRFDRKGCGSIPACLPIDAMFGRTVAISPFGAAPSIHTQAISYLTFTTIIARWSHNATYLTIDAMVFSTVAISPFGAATAIDTNAVSDVPSSTIILVRRDWFNLSRFRRWRERGWISIGSTIPRRNHW